ncbi:dehydrodolichyl diphosphate synthase complex subunit NUS1 [Coccinella septempunctata]|uniref:dehydrodolichyl diphosphate synthase complex subunit NUS1 n=1 Tax=Coccinella septempunctata TaxID=41139 RepID=UPI001D098234|nr:dehydrodolichyl diphosphate synthase complex subunit NUS1 [Coccinella septempunctata]
MMKKVYEIIYSIVYSLFIFYETVNDFWNNLKKQSNNSITLEYFEEKGFECLKKKPNHITFIIDEEPSFKDLANLVLWCLIARISFVSFYDYRGVLEKNEEKLEIEINRIKQQNDYVLWHNRKSDSKNGIVGRKVHLKIITKADGKYNIERVCRELITKKESVSNISIEYVDKCLKEQFGFPDPEVGIIFSKIFSLFEYPPWEIRLTEFFRLNSHHNILFSEFVAVLDKYSKCNQRLGT